jgi:hypothetical protein
VGLRLVPSIALSLLATVGPASAQGPAAERPIPPPGIVLAEADRAELLKGAEDLGREIASLQEALKERPALLDLVPDVQIYWNAVRYAVGYDEIFDAQEVEVARRFLAKGHERARQLGEGRAPWTTATGLVVRGYVSKIDGSVQPYGLVVPESYHAGEATKHRLDVWLHGRAEKLSELAFLEGRETTPGDFTPKDAFVLHPYGRFCNANKLAGEVDVFEALEHARRAYPLDDDRIAVRGFSMGGAAAWHLSVHHPGTWAACAPGAGFSETADFLKVLGNETLTPTAYEKALFHLYDATDYALNLVHCPTVAYSGEIDKQKQAADRMAEAMAQEGLTLVHVIGPKTAHSYEPGAKAEIDRRIDAILARGRDPLARRVRFTTFTLRYNQVAWLRLLGLDHHWERARFDGEIVDSHTVRATTTNVSSFLLEMAPGQSPLDPTHRATVLIDGQPLVVPGPSSDRSWSARFRKVLGRWTAVTGAEAPGLRKRPGLQGPVDDAFMDRFVFVMPTGAALNERVGAWVAAESHRAVERWRRQFRGEAQVRTDATVTDADIASSNLVLWGDPGSNRLLARIADKLPFRWDDGGLRVGAKTYDAGRHVPILIYPNPLNPERYVVLNSGFTYREYDDLNNARQIPKLPDWAIVDLKTPPSSRAPGAVVDAGFFGESWELLAAPAVGSARAGR